MNKHKQRQLGFAHLVIIIILAVALLGTLGFVFWQNFMQPKSNVSNSKSDDSRTKTDTNSVISSEVVLTEITSDQTNNSGLSIKYPKNWVVEHKVDSDIDTNKVSSPDGSVSVQLTVYGHGGFGGWCEPSDFELVKIENKLLSNYAGYSLFLYVSNYKVDDTYAYNISVQKDTAENKAAKIGDSSCIIGGMPFSINEKDQYATLKIILNNVTVSDSSLTGSFNQAIATDDYKTAEKIALSLYVK